MLLISPDFMHSDYCYSIEMQCALKRHEHSEARVIPIILRHVDWEIAPFSKLQALPIDGKPIASWLDRDEAFWNVAREIRKVVNKLLAQQWFKEGDTLFELKYYEAALSSYQEAIRLNSTNAVFYNGKGTSLYELKRFEEALSAYQEAIRLNPTLVDAYRNKGQVLQSLAEEAFNKVKELESTDKSIISTHADI